MANTFQVLFYLLVMSVPAIGLLAGISMVKTARIRRKSRDRLLELFEAQEAGDIDDDPWLLHDSQRSPFATHFAKDQRVAEDGNPYRAPQERFD